MSDVVNLIKLRDDSSKGGLTQLIDTSYKKIGLLPCLVDAKWDENSWQYIKPNQNILFKKVGGACLPPELENIGKIYVIDRLWKNRYREEAYSFSYVVKWVIPIKIWAEMGVEHLSQINQDLYDSTIRYLKTRYKSSASASFVLNSLIDYLVQYDLLAVNIDKVIAGRVLGNEKYESSLTKQSKMPLPELVKSVIHLKWAVDDHFDGSHKAINDKLCVLTQVFQYGLGLRIGEVLRLPYDPLIDMNGEVFCLVWTEKGSEPVARYVPSIWRKPLKQAVDEIQCLTKPYRESAIQIEEKNSVPLLRRAVSNHHDKKQKILLEKTEALNSLLHNKACELAVFLGFLKDVKAGDVYEIKVLKDIFPIASTAKSVFSLVKFYQRLGLEIVSKPIGRKKKRYYVSGKSLISILEELINKRENYVSLREFLKILGCSGTKARRTKDKLINELTERLHGRLNVLAFSDNRQLDCSGASVVVLSKSNALKIFSNYVFGGYDNKRFISIKELEQLLPKLGNRRQEFKDTLSPNKHTFYATYGSSRGYIRTNGFLVDLDKIEKFLVKEYVRINSLSVEENIDTEVSISSKSFSVKQKVSDYLFLRSGMWGGEYHDYIPQVLGYFAVRYFFIGNENQLGAFNRYAVDADDNITQSWRSHQARHWQTTSLFRAGMAALVVNKWMGRASSSHADNYDHNTGRERAKIVGEAMLQDSDRFLGALPEKVKEWRAKEIPVADLTEHLNASLESVQYSPLGYCTTNLFLKPCEINLRCLTGNEGKGCRHYIYDLKDISHREKVTAERDKSALELTRLFKAYESGIEAAEMHIKHHMMIVKNTTAILEKAELILRSEQVDTSKDFMPFIKEGSGVGDCPFQCGEDE